MEWLVGAFIALVAVAMAAFSSGRARGKAAGEKVAQEAKREAAGERTKAEAADSRRRVEDEIRELPASSDGERLSAADRLRRDWSRD